MPYLTRLRAMCAFVSARLREPSTISGLGVAIAGGAALPPPYSLVVILCGIIAMFMKDAADATAR